MADIIPCRFLGLETDPGKLQIQIVAGHVAKLGDAHEATFIANPQNAFLQDKSSSQYLYYQWLIACYRHEIDMNRLQELEEYYANQYLRRAPLGYLDLSTFDKQYLFSLLEQNNASKDSIRILRKWCLDRAHSIASTAFIFYSHLASVMQTPHDPTCFDRIKNTLYALNDVFFNYKSAVWKGPYTSTLSAAEEETPVDIIKPFYTYLPTILYYSLGIAQSSDQRQKLVKLVEIWRSKEIVDASQYHLFQSLVSGVAEPPAPPEFPTLYPISLTSSDLALFKRALPPPPPPMPPSISISHLPPPPPFSQHLLPPPPFPPHLTQNHPLQHTSVHHHSPTDSSFSPPPPLPAVTIDPLAIPVGALANLVKGYLRCGGEPFTTIDPLQSQISVQPHVEPGRVNVRMMDFYRKLETMLPPPPPPPSIR